MNPENTLQLFSSSRNLSKMFRTGPSRDDTLDLSAIPDNTFAFRTFQDTSLRAVLDESTTVFGANNTVTATGNDLCEVFYDIMQSCRQSEILDTVRRLAQACCDSLENVEPWNRTNVHNYWLAEEANSWRLLHCLYSDSLQEKVQSLEGVSDEPVLSQQRLVSGLFESDAELTLLQLLVDWLEASAAYQEHITQAVPGGAGSGAHWANTIYELVVGPSLFNKEKRRALVTQVDPDAPRRQKKAIHSDDQQDDNDLCKRVFKEVRCGKFNEATALCKKAGQAWRSGVLHGWRLLHYLPRENQLSKLEIEGNPSRDLWKWCCLGIVEDTSENIFYKATIGILCGHLQSALAVCHGNWEDLLWAHLRVQTELRVDRFLREHHSTAHASTTSPEVLEMLQKEYQPTELSLQQVFGCVNALMNGKSESYYQTCQRYLMLGHISSIMQESLEWLEITEQKFVRFLAHLVLILRQMGKDPHHDIGDKILQTYVSLLIKQKSDGTIESPELIAFYTSTVPTVNQIELYADLMDRIHKRDFRQRVVKAGIGAGVDVGASARLAVKKSITDIQQGYGNIDVTFSQTIEIEKDKSLVHRVISSIEWLAFVPNQVEEALWLSNSMIRTFIFIGNTDAASQTLSTFNQLFPSIVNKVPSSSSSLREYLCLKAYLEALDGFATWYRHFISGQPKDVEPLHVDASFTDKVHHEQLLAQVAQKKARCEAAILHHAKHTKTLLYKVITFPGGWLQDESDGTNSSNFTQEEYDERSKQLITLRKLCIPEIVLLILKVLQSGTDVNNHVEAIKLSNIIAAENRGLYKVFTKDKLVEVLHRIKESSLFVLEKGKDSFGFNVNND